VSVIGTVERLWRYPVKSMRGEELESAFVGFSGVYGDRIFAFQSSASPKSFPYLTARVQEAMLQYQPRFRDNENIPNTGAFTVEVRAPDGEVFSIDDPALILRLATGLRNAPAITLLRSDHAMTDCHPISLFAIQTAQQLGEELGVAIDPRRFRANIDLNFVTAGRFGENELVGRTVRLGKHAVLSILERDKRCRMISLDPDSGASTPEVLHKVARDHDGTAGVYAAVLAEGTVCRGDTAELLD
jgi:uncharacterized protein YcbX